MKAVYRITSFEQYLEQYKLSTENPEAFWGEIANNFTWKSPWQKVLNWNFTEPNIRWFEGAKLNITENILERNIERFPDKKAILWEANEINSPSKAYTFSELLVEVSKVANALKSLGVKKGDRVCLYMPMIPELAFSVLACARIGAVHSVVFAGFSASALADRVEDAQAKVIVTTDGLLRGPKSMSLKNIVDEALNTCSCVEKVLMYKYSGDEAKWNPDKDVLWNDIVPGQAAFCEAESMDAEDPLFILYTSGSTGKPKGILHSSGGYMVYTAYSFQNVYQYETDDVFWCTADIGWITGHSYILYGPLLNGATSLMFEGIPTYPSPSRFWEIVEKYKVNQLLTAPTAIRSLMSFGSEIPRKFEMTSLKTLGSVGEPINEEAWQWYKNYVGKMRCSVVDNWWQTETGGIMISGLGDFSPQKASYAGFPLPGIQPVLLNQEGKEIENADEEGYLCIKHPWPSMLRSTWGDHERCRVTYFSHYDGFYFTGDGAKRDEKGMFRIIGRVDDVINVSGHRFGTAEIENAINKCEAVVESAVVAYPHDIKGQAIYAFVIANTEDISVLNEVKSMVANQIGKIALPEKIQIVSGLPKTRSGKIMRRILRKIAEGDTSNLGDTSTLLDPNVVDEIVRKAL